MSKSTSTKSLSDLTKGEVVVIQRNGPKRYSVVKVERLRSGRLRLWANPATGSWSRATPASLGVFADGAQFTVEVA